MSLHSSTWQHMAGERLRTLRVFRGSAESVSGSYLSRCGVCGVYSVEEFANCGVSRSLNTPDSALDSAYFPAVVERVTSKSPAKPDSAHFPAITMRVTAIARSLRSLIPTLTHACARARA